MKRYQFNCWTQAQADRLKSLLNDEFSALEITTEDWTSLDVKDFASIFLWCDCCIAQENLERIVVNSENIRRLAIPVGFRDSLEWREVEYTGCIDLD